EEHYQHTNRCNEAGYQVPHLETIGTQAQLFTHHILVKHPGSEDDRSQACQRQHELAGQLIEKIKDTQTKQRQTAPVIERQQGSNTQCPSANASYYGRSSTTERRTFFQELGHRFKQGNSRGQGCEGQQQEE